MKAKRPADEKARAADQLRADMTELEHEMAESMQVLADLDARAAAAEAPAMEAIRRGDDRTARAFLLEQATYAEKAAAVRADLKVLRAILAECYEFANKLSEKSTHDNSEPP